MKSFFTVVSLLMVTALYSFTHSAGIDDVIAAMKTGNASQVAKFFDASVEISMPDKSNSLAKARQSWF